MLTLHTFGAFPPVDMLKDVWKVQLEVFPQPLPNVIEHQLTGAAVLSCAQRELQERVAKLSSGTPVLKVAAMERQESVKPPCLTTTDALNTTSLARQWRRSALCQVAFTAASLVSPAL